MSPSQPCVALPKDILRAVPEGFVGRANRRRGWLYSLTPHLPFRTRFRASCRSCSPKLVSAASRCSRFKSTEQQRHARAVAQQLAQHGLMGAACANGRVRASCEHEVAIERHLAVQLDKGASGGLMERGTSCFVAVLRQRVISGHPRSWARRPSGCLCARR